MDPEQTAPMSSLIWVHTVCHRGFINISADEKSRRLLLRVNIDLMFVIFQYKDAFMKANPDYKWHNPDKSPPNQKSATPKPTNVLRNEIDLLAEGSIMPGKLAG